MSVPKANGKKRKHVASDLHANNAKSVVTVQPKASIDAITKDLGAMEAEKPAERATKRVKRSSDSAKSTAELAKKIAYNRKAEKAYRREQATEKASTLDALESAIKIMSTEQSINQIKQIDPEGYLNARKKGKKKKRLAEAKSIVNNLKTDSELSDAKIAQQTNIEDNGGDKGSSNEIVHVHIAANTTNPSSKGHKHKRGSSLDKSRRASVIDEKSKARASSTPEDDQTELLLQDLEVENSRTLSAKQKKKSKSKEPEIEIDVALPEPQSKKQARKSRKTSKNDPEQPADRISASMHAQVTAPTDLNHETDALQSPKSPARVTRSAKSTGKDDTPAISEFGIWVANLPFSLNKSSLKDFFSSSGIPEADIIRVNLSAPVKNSGPSQKNRGFAYVDFGSKESYDKAITLHDKLLSGRQVMIKDSKNFEGRPAKQKDETVAEAEENPPSNRIHVKNLPFEADATMLRSLFEPCGIVTNVFVATFEDNQAKCKGYAWVTFEELDSAIAAVRGWVDLKEDDASKLSTGKDESTTSAKSKKQKKRTVNRLLGRELTISFAEDSSTRYSKRFGVPKAKSKPQNPEISKPNMKATAFKSGITEDLPVEKLNIRPRAPSTASSVVSTSSSSVSSVSSSPVSSPSASRASTPDPENPQQHAQPKQGSDVLRRILQHTIASNKALEKRRKKAGTKV